MVVVKVEKLAGDGQGFRVSGILRGLSLVAKDIAEYRLMGKAVINMPLDVYGPAFDRPFSRRSSLPRST
jgi:hypothetical protein